MGAASASELMSDVCAALIRHKVSVKVRKRIYKDLIPAWEDYDCDTLYEIVDEDPAFKSVFQTMNPEE